MPMRDWNGHCHRCGEKSLSHIMSMYSSELICSDCKKSERTHDDYKQAEARDLEEYAGRMGGYGCHPEQIASVRETARKLREGEL